MEISIIKGDITQLEADAIVNAANESLLGGGGVDGAIHRAAGKELLDYCRTLNGCRTGEAKITPGFNLKAQHIIHTVGPVWHGGKSNEAHLLSNCYTNSLRLATEHGCRSIIFPCISTGVYHFPKQEAAKIAIEAIIKLKKEHKSIMDVTICVFDDENLTIYRKLLEERSKTKN